jgi:TolB-like protein
MILPMKSELAPRQRPWRSMRFLVAALSLVLAPGCASRTTTTDSGRLAAPSPNIESIAVVPFENLSHSRNAGLIMTDLATSILYTQDRFRVVEVSGLTDDTEVKLRRFDITPWQRQLGVNTTAGANIGRDLKVDWVLVGSVGEYGFVDGFGETANVGGNLRLVRVSDQQVVWANAFSKRAAVSAFSQDSIHRLTQEVLQEQLNRMVREMVEGRRAEARASQ